jgi:hypothetical protein
MTVSELNQQTAFVGNTDVYEQSRLTDERHAARPNGDAPKCTAGGHPSFHKVGHARNGSMLCGTDNAPSTSSQRDAPR